MSEIVRTVKDCMEEWRLNGVLHRLDGPARIVTGKEYDEDLFQYEWWVNGERHREDGPAIIGMDGAEEWHLHGVLHREDGPAVINSNRLEWWLNGTPHRTIGPAYIYTDSDYLNHEYWYVHGKVLDKIDEWLDKTGYSWPLNQSQEVEFKLTFC